MFSIMFNKSTTSLLYTGSHKSSLIQNVCRLFTLKVNVYIRANYNYKERKTTFLKLSRKYVPFKLLFNAYWSSKLKMKLSICYLHKSFSNI